MNKINSLADVAQEAVQCVDDDLYRYIIRTAHNQRLTTMLPQFISYCVQPFRLDWVFALWCSGVSGLLCDAPQQGHRDGAQLRRSNRNTHIGIAAGA